MLYSEAIKSQHVDAQINNLYNNVIGDTPVFQLSNYGYPHNLNFPQRFSD